MSNDIVSCSADKSLIVWDGCNGNHIRRLRGHDSIINSCATVPNNATFVASGSDDGCAILWDVRCKYHNHVFRHNHQICCVTMSNDGNMLFASGVDGVVRGFDIRMNKLDIVLSGHEDCVTGLAVGPDDNVLLSNSADGSLRTWNIKRFADNDRMLNCCFDGVKQGAEKLLLRCSFSSTDNLLGCGSSERVVRIRDDNLTEIFSFSGHKSAVVEVIFHPTRRIMASGGSDKQVIIGCY